ncbi:phosphotransferase enzyme family protein [Spirosoma sp. KUDC1026]|uniref:phosphotransferase enzyme family protein n=1 Tax=Spirosoma sp. KUDC1026 TaxID=2745947 RepID=UPI00159BB2D2|nr:phosphotransferase [Spirosoma sp. KUDC1026]QKZ12399.1 phosphotransferase [Spirosoma sp. KUDC1026]
MALFPVSSSIVSATALAPFLAEQYGLRSEATCKLLKAGISHTYLLTNGPTRFIFRLYTLNWRSRTEILEEVRLLYLLQEKDIPVSYAIPDQTGEYIQEITAAEGLRYGVMFSYATGEKLFTFTTEVHAHIGEVMARMHQLTHKLHLNRETYTPERLLVDSFVYLQQRLPADTDEMRFMQRAQTYLLHELQHADTAQLRQGIVHLDIWFDNLHIDRDHRVTLFDFDFCGNGWLCLDVAYYILQIHSTEKVEQERDQKVASFLAGYESVTPLTGEEKRLLPMLGVTLYFFYLGIQCQRYENWSNVFLTETHLKRYVNFLVKKYFDDHGLG